MWQLQQIGMKKLSRALGHHLASVRANEQGEEWTPDNSHHDGEQIFSDEIFSKQGFSLCQIMGNFNKAFVICCFNQNIYLIDQHAASEKSLYVRFLKQKNLLPKPYHGKPFQILNIYKEVLQQQKNILKNLGWTYQVLSSGPVFITARLSSVPSIYDHECSEAEFLQIVESYHENSIEDLSKTQKQVMASIACHNAYRIGDDLSRNDMRELVDTLYEMSGAFNCPHNRPVVIMLGNARELRKQKTEERRYDLW